MLPGEQRVRRSIREDFADDFRLARDMLELGHQVHHALCAEESRRVSNLTKALAVGLYTKLCKQYRSIHALSELGLTDDAEILVRAMFESSMIVAFLFRHRVTYRRGKNSPAPVPPKGRLTTDFRAEVYRAHLAIQRQKHLRAWLRTPGLKREATRRMKGVDADIATIKSEFGSADWGKWEKWLRNYTILGLTVEQMARNLRLQTWYAVVYRWQSEAIHGGDALRHLDVDNATLTITPTLGADNAKATGPLLSANVPFVIATSAINDRFQLGMDQRIRDLVDRGMARVSK